MSIRSGVVAFGVLLWHTVLAGEVYKVTVTREAQDLYRVDYSHPKVYVKTRCCYVYCYYEDALIDTANMEIRFLASDEECDIDKILVERDNGGRYR